MCLLCGLLHHYDIISKYHHDCDAAKTACVFIVSHLITVHNLIIIYLQLVVSVRVCIRTVRMLVTETEAACTHSWMYFAL